MTKITYEDLGKKNYRINFILTEHAEKKDSLEKYLPRYFEILQIIYQYREPEDLLWHHFEPHVELTMFSDANLFEIISGKLDDFRDEISILSAETNDHFFADWYHNSPEEALFGMLSMDMTARLAMLFYAYRESISIGKTVDKMFMRRVHVLANQLGLDYSKEARLLSDRALIASILGTEGVTMDSMKEQFRKITGRTYD